jgi:hypothetical protein
MINSSIHHLLEMTLPIQLDGLLLTNKMMQLLLVVEMLDCMVGITSSEINQELFFIWIYLHTSWLESNSRSTK